MKKTVLYFLASLILLPLGAQAQEVDGLWLFPTQPGYTT
jgi:hypothetical protein